MPPVRVLADHHVYRLPELITDDHHLDTFNPEEGLPAQVGTYEALIIRTVTPINRHTLPQKGRLRLIATASVGFDHIDLVHLEQLGIQVVSAAGSNARAVAEYVATMLLYTCMNQGWDYRTLSVGIVGVGHTGGAVHALMEKMGVRCRLYDPPRSKREPGFISCTREEVLDTDILTLHTPLDREGEQMTYHWLDRSALSQGPRKLLIQASRGGVVDEQALLEAMDRPEPLVAVMDVWEGEPVVNKRLLEKAFIATPHIAGYSQQAKIMATVSVMKQLNTFFNLPTSSIEALKDQWMQELVPPLPEDLQSEQAHYPVPGQLMQEYLQYDRLLKQGLLHPTEDQAQDSAAYFRYLRTSLPYRLEYASWKSHLNRVQGWPLWRLMADTD